MRIAIVDCGTAQGDGAAATYQSLLICNCSSRIQAKIAKHLNLSALIVQAADSQIQGGLANDRTIGRVIDLPGMACDGAGRADIATGIVYIAHRKIDCSAAGDIAGIRIVQHLAMGIHGQRSASLHAATGILNGAGLQIDALRAGNRSQAIIQLLAIAIDSYIAPGNARAIAVRQAVVIQDHIATSLDFAAGVMHEPRQRGLHIPTDRRERAASIVQRSARYDDVACGCQQAAGILDTVPDAHLQSSASRYFTLLI